MGPILTCLDHADRLFDFLFRLFAQLVKVLQNPLQYFFVCFTGMELHRFESVLDFLAELNCCGGHGIAMAKAVDIDSYSVPYHPRQAWKWTGWDLNPRPLPCQDSDLPADLPARV